MKNNMDKLLKVEVIAKTPNPQQVIYAAMHQDYSEEFVADSKDKWPAEDKCGEIVVKRLLAGGRGHYGCYSADTEVLTKTGWKAWPAITKDDELLAVNIETQQAHFEKPSALQALDVLEGDKLYRAEGEYISLLVTQDHRIVLAEYEENTPLKSRWHFMEGVSELLDLDNFKRFPFTCFLAENERFYPEMPENFNSLDLMGFAGYFFYEDIKAEEFSHLPTWVIKNFWDESTKKKVLPIWFIQLPADYILSFFASMDIDRQGDNYWGIEQPTLGEKWGQEIAVDRL